MKKRENKLTKAQTTHDASFGSVVVTAFYVMYSISHCRSVHSSLIVYKLLVEQKINK